MRRDTQEGKPRYDLVMPENGDGMFQRWAVHMAKGALKYGDRNWELAKTKIEYVRFKASAFRHFIQWFNGEQDEDHAAAVFFNIQAAEYTKHRMKPECKHLPAEFPYICALCQQTVYPDNVVSSTIVPQRDDKFVASLLDEEFNGGQNV